MSTSINLVDTVLTWRLQHRLTGAEASFLRKIVPWKQHCAARSHTSGLQGDG